MDELILCFIITDVYIRNKETFASLQSDSVKLVNYIIKALCSDNAQPRWC